MATPVTLVPFKVVYSTTWYHILSTYVRVSHHVISCAFKLQHICFINRVYNNLGTLTYLWWFITSGTKNLRCWVEQIIYFTTTYFHFHYDHYICHASFLMQIHCNTLYLNCHTCTHWEPFYLWDKHGYID